MVQKTKEDAEVKLSPVLAQQIVHDIHDVLHQEINFMDENGLIIASTDFNRINQIHEGAQIVIQSKKQLTIHSDHQYEGTRKGINMPVFFDHEVIGVIGITGDEKDVLCYGQILQKMTQILIRDAYDRDIRNQKRTNDRLWIEQLIQARDDPHLHPSFHTIQNHAFQFLYAIPSRPMNAGQIEQVHRLTESPTYAEMIQKKAIYSSEMILLINKTPLQKIDSLIDAAKKIADEIYWGIGNTYEEKKALYTAYQQAKQSAIWGKRILHIPLIAYEKSELGMLVPWLAQQDNTPFLQSVFHSLPQEKIMSILSFLDLYEQANGSLKKAAEIGNMHKNTIQYKILQIIQETGYDPRQYHDFTILKTAALLYRYKYELNL